LKGIVFYLLLFIEEDKHLGVPLRVAALCPYWWAGIIRRALAFASRSFLPCGEGVFIAIFFIIPQ
jgi:hypothetical protein